MRTGVLVAVVDPRTFGMNLWLIIGAVILAVFALIVLLALVTGVRVFWWQARRRAAEAADQRRRVRPDGQPYPPAARGFCTRCGQGGEQVYHLPDGTRLCPACYHVVEGRPECETSARGRRE